MLLAPYWAEKSLNIIDGMDFNWRMVAARIRRCRKDSFMSNLNCGNSIDNSNMLESVSGHLIQQQLTTSFLNTGLTMKETDKTEDDLVLNRDTSLWNNFLFFFLVCKQCVKTKDTLLHIMTSAINLPLLHAYWLIVLILSRCRNRATVQIDQPAVKILRLQ